ncbi:MAG: cupin domain-containing protein, partial [Candidatus Thorarchaeota archaeon]|nr:cupin domain-containing protein [Candidatus Thorarchaeota archaeon]
WPQAFVILEGKGKILIEHEEFELQAQTVYYIPRNCTHQVHADEVVELLWLAWAAE